MFTVYLTLLIFHPYFISAVVKKFNISASIKVTKSKIVDHELFFSTVHNYLGVKLCVIIWAENLTNNKYANHKASEYTGNNVFDLLLHRSKIGHTFVAH